ncbi:MAG: hypothetical protein JXB39_06135 [Deltaproteobacteria bacterium]|nr:hypothetical protein [Deltaproteobacteria bacterium]
MKDSEDRQQGRRWIHAVERILDDPEQVIALADRLAQEAYDAAPTAEDEARRDLAAGRIVHHFATRAMWSGGATGLPALLPGAGTLLALAGGALVDVALVLRFEVEMALALSWVYGFDIRQEDERRRALLLASVSVHDAHTGGDFLRDVARAESEALWRLGPRQVPRLLLQVAARLARRTVVGGRILPVAGIAVGAATDRILTERVGRRCTESLRQRRAESATVPQDDVVDAVVAGARKRRKGVAP